ncbi:hypothetical protein LU699_03600 [Luteimonas fraxinea]|uniref:hypothetical protein n=1 Tax=Luteimonas fraxinea TaxID=2901869 RepID=UPI001E5D3F72|nr:hypothetical protein [Luteimonas fraxinea]MCD9124588.1 hypothetical protein [Luteimonas fraxinea]UHH10829.1 hypothetical protein LU699_03600 [Luteimonas fraxinea]
MASSSTWWCGLVLALGVGALSACGPSSPDSDVDSMGPDLAEAPQAQDLERSLEGIWSTGVSGGDDAETIYAIEWQSVGGLRILRDGSWLAGTVEDVDLDNQTLAFHITRENGPDETVTLRKVQDAASGEGFHLRVTWAQGQTETLGFVRRLTDRDRQEIVLEVRQSAVLPEAVACGGDAPASSLRATLACSQSEFAELDRGLRTQLVELSARYPDGDRTAAAVVQQLDACKTPECLRDAYAQWQTYFDENYDLGDVLDYL